MRDLLVKCKRYGKFLCQFAVEKMRGLDFTLPAASEEIQNSREYNGYCKTPEKHMALILLDGELTEIARRNMKKLGLERVECIQGNAVTFERYGEFNVFFLFNPFSSAVLSQVLEKILQTLEDSPREIYIIYHHPVHYHLLEVPGLHRESVLYDRLKNYETYIYTNRT